MNAIRLETYEDSGWVENGSLKIEGDKVVAEGQAEAFLDPFYDPDGDEMVYPDRTPELFLLTVATHGGSARCRWVEEG